MNKIKKGRNSAAIANNATTAHGAEMDDGKLDRPVERYAEIVYQPDATPEFPYNVKIITNGLYCGCGRFCRTEAEAKWYISITGNIQIMDTKR